MITKGVTSVNANLILSLETQTHHQQVVALPLADGKPSQDSPIVLCVSESANPFQLSQQGNHVLVWQNLDDHSLMSIYEVDSGDISPLYEGLEADLAIRDLAFEPDLQQVYAIDSTGHGLNAYQINDQPLESIDSLTLTDRSLTQLYVFDSSPYVYGTAADSDEIVSFELAKEVVWREVNRLSLSEDFVPCQLVVHPHLDIAYILGRGASEIITAEFDPATASFDPFLTMSTLPKESKANQPLKLMALQADASQLVVANGADHGIAVYGIHPKAGATQLLKQVDYPGSVGLVASKEDNWAYTDLSGQTLSLAQSQDDKLLSVVNSVDLSFSSLHQLLMV